MENGLVCLQGPFIILGMFTQCVYPYTGNHVMDAQLALFTNFIAQRYTKVCKNLTDGFVKSSTGAETSHTYRAQRMSFHPQLRISDTMLRISESRRSRET